MDDFYAALTSLNVAFVVVVEGLESEMESEVNSSMFVTLSQASLAYFLAIPRRDI